METAQIREGFCKSQAQILEKPPYIYAAKHRKKVTMKEKTPVPVQKKPDAQLAAVGKSMSPPPFQLKAGDAPAQLKLADDALVVRGGESSAENLQTNQSHDPRGHISANSANGADLDTLAQSPEAFRNGKITVSDVGTIRGISNDQGKAMDVLEDGNDRNPLHASIDPFNKALSTKEANDLSKAFTAQPNKWKKK